MNYDQQQQPVYGNPAPSPYSATPPMPQMGYTQQPYQAQAQAQAQPYQAQAQPYQAQPQMTVGGGNRNALNKPYNAAGQRDWSYDLCDCTGDCSTCCAAWFCPCMVYQSNISRRRHLESHGTPHREGGENAGGDCCTFVLVQWFGCGWLLNMSDREATRQRYNIHSDSCGDCPASYFCLPLALTQQSREIEEEERSFLGQGYMQNGEK